MNDSMPVESAKDLFFAKKLSNPMRKRCLAAMAKILPSTDRPIIKVEDDVYQYNEAQAPKHPIARIQQRVAKMNVWQLRKHARRTEQRAKGTGNLIDRINRTHLPHKVEIMARLNSEKELLTDTHDAIVIAANARHCLA